MISRSKSFPGRAFLISFQNGPINQWKVLQLPIHSTGMFAQPDPNLVFRSDPFARYGFERAMPNRANKLSRRRKISSLRNYCRRAGEFRAEFETDLSDDRQCSDGPGIQFMHVVSCHVLYDASARLRNSSRRFDDLHPDDPISNSSNCSQWSLSIRSDNASHCCVGTVPGIERQELIVG